MRLVNLVLVILLAGCAPTAYGPVTGLGGYSGRQIAEDTWEVTFRSNARSDEGYALTAALYRSAELASAAGFPYIQIVRFRGTTTRVGTRGSYGSYAGQTINLKVRGVHSPDTGLVCENEGGRDCRTLVTATVLRELDSVIWNRTPPSPADSANL